MRKLKVSELLGIFNRDSRKHNLFISQGCKFLKQEHSINTKEPKIKFYPLCEQKESCSYLVINDSIHLYFKELFFEIFENIIKAKEGTNSGYMMSFLDDGTLEKLVNPTKYTKYKFYNLYNIVSSTSFSKNLISFDIDFNNSQECANVIFKYPLRNMLDTLQSNTIFGIHLEDNEIKLFKQIYDNCIIKTINELFNEPVQIPKSSNSYPIFYILMSIRLMIKKVYLEKYRIRENNRLMLNIKDYDISNLNQYKVFTDKNNIYTEEEQKLDQESYQNELIIREASEPNWLALKDETMENKQPVEQKQNTKSNELITIIDYFGKYVQVNKEKYEKKLASINLKEFEDNYQKMQNSQAWDEIFYWQKQVLDILKIDGGGLWFDTRIKKYCFRSKVGAKIVYEGKDGIGELLTRALREKITNFLNQNNNGFFFSYAIEIVLVSKIKGINNHMLKTNERASNTIKILLFENAIITIDDDTFDTSSPDEFIKANNDFFYTRNRFVPTKYLKKRFDKRKINCNYSSISQKFFIKNNDTYLYEKNKENSDTMHINNNSSFITQFIFYLVNEDYHQYYYVINWLAYFFNSLEKSGTALVLLGDQEVTQNIFWDKIIKEIFGLQYCITIDDKECETASSFDIAKDKLFFHIADIANPTTKFDDETLYKLVKDLLIKPSILKLNENNEEDEVAVHGQMLITAKNPFPYIKRAISKCTIIKVNDMDTIIEKLDIPDEIILEDNIQKDLENFTAMLHSFQGDYNLTQYAIDTEYRQTVKNNKTSNIDKEDIENKIDAFIQAIKTRDLDYFEEVKDIVNDEIYQHLEIAFHKDEDIDKGYFIGRDLLEYYNAKHEQKFESKKELMDKLKEKDKMFQQEVKTLKILDKDKKEKVLFQAYQTSKEIKYKELYKILDYKMRGDIIIPFGATVISSQENLEKFDYEDMEDKANCIKRTQEYRAEKEEKKAKEKEER